MGIYNEILAGRFNRGLQKLFQIKGAAPVPQLSGEVTPSHVLFSGVENRILEGWFKYANFTAIGPSAGNFSIFRIRNPVGSKVIAVLEKITFADPALTMQPFLVSYNLNMGADYATIITSAVQVDSRRIGPAGQLTSNPVCILSTAQQAAFIAGTFIWKGIGSTTAGTLDAIVSDVSELPLAPGSAYDFGVNLVNTELDITTWWRERPLEDSEATV